MGKWGGEREWEKISKIFFSPASACAGKKGNNAVQNSTVSVFFFSRKGNVIGKNPKMGYDRNLERIIANILVVQIRNNNAIPCNLIQSSETLSLNLRKKVFFF